MSGLKCGKCGEPDITMVHFYEPCIRGPASLSFHRCEASGCRGGRFTCAEHLLRHIMLTHKEKECTFSGCTKTCYNRDIAFAHVISEHLPGPCFVCMLCGDKFVRLSTARCHITVQHKDAIQTPLPPRKRGRKRAKHTDDDTDDNIDDKIDDNTDPMTDVDESTEDEWVPPPAPKTNHAPIHQTTAAITIKLPKAIRATEGLKRLCDSLDLGSLYDSSDSSSSESESKPDSGPMLEQHAQPPSSLVPMLVPSAFLSTATPCPLTPSSSVPLSAPPPISTTGPTASSSSSSSVVPLADLPLLSPSRIIDPLSADLNEISRQYHDARLKTIASHIEKNKQSSTACISNARRLTDTLVSSQRDIEDGIQKANNDLLLFTKTRVRLHDEIRAKVTKTRLQLMIDRTVAVSAFAQRATVTYNEKLEAVNVEHAQYIASEKSRNKEAVEAHAKAMADLKQRQTAALDQYAKECQLQAQSDAHNLSSQ